ncbi:MAG: hypothetical protein WEB58_01415 [Planctomycetaceae bacterium]
MKRKNSIFVVLLITGMGCFVYVASYIAIRLTKPECLNSHEGPAAAFNSLYYPLRYLDAKEPQWYSTASVQNSWLEARIDGVNRGNGYLYFTWDGHEARAFNGDSRGFEVGSAVFLHFRYELETADDFTSRLMPTIDQIRPSDRSIK